MDSQPSSEGGDREELEGGPAQGAPQHYGPPPPPPLPHPKEAVVQTQEVTEIRPTLAAAAAAPAAVALPLPTGPRVTVPVGWKRIVLLDSVIYYR